MASVYVKRWTSRGPNGRRVKHVAWGFTLMVDGKRERRFSSEWATKERAWAELRERTKAIEAGQLAPREPQTLVQVAEEHLRFKADNGKRSIGEDRRILKTRLLPAFGAELLVRDLRGNLIAKYERRRAGRTTGRDPAMCEKVALNETGLRLWGLVARGRFRKRGDRRHRVEGAGAMAPPGAWKGDGGSAG